MIRFWSKVDKRGPDDCWPWLAYTNAGGYGVITIAGKQVLAHRQAYQIARSEEIPQDTCVCHRCDSPGCMNPTHLFLGTHDDNMQDMVQKGRCHTKLSGDQAQGIRLDPRTTRSIDKDYGIHQTMVSRIKRGEAWAS